MRILGSSPPISSNTSLPVPIISFVVGAKVISPSFGIVRFGLVGSGLFITVGVLILQAFAPVDSHIFVSNGSKH